MPLGNVSSAWIENVQRHLKKVCAETSPDALYLKLAVEPPAPLTSLMPSLSDLHAMYKAESNVVSFIEYLRQNTSIQQVDALRSLDQSDPAWLAARRGHITAGVADSIRSVKDVHNCRTLVDKILGNDKPFKSCATDFGKENEHVARQLYIVNELKAHKNFEVNTCGLVLNNDLPFMGASPDGVASCSCHGEKLVEIKCSYKHRGIPVKDIPTRNTRFMHEPV